MGKEKESKPKETEEKEQKKKRDDLKKNFFWGGLFRAVPVANGSSQARGQIRAVAASLTTATATPAAPDPSQVLNALSEARHEPESSWILVGFVTAFKNDNSFEKD